MSDMEVDYGEIDETAMDVFEDIATELGITTTQFIDSLPRYDIDPTEVTSEQAERLKTAGEERDADEFDAVLEELGVPDKVREQVVEQFRQIDRGDLPVGEGYTPEDADESAEMTPVQPDSKGSSDGPSRKEVQQMIRKEVQQSVPSAAQIADELESRMGGGGGGDDGGLTAQQEMALNLAKQWLQPGPNEIDSTVAQAEQEMQRGMAEAFGQMARQMSRPSIGQKLGLAIEDSLMKSMADGMEISIGGEPVTVEPPDDDDSDGDDADESDDDDE